MSRKTRVKKHAKFDGRLLALRSKIRARKSIIEGLSHFKCEYPYEQVLLYSAVLSKDRSFGPIICGNPFPKSLPELKNTKIL